MHRHILGGAAILALTGLLASAGASPAAAGIECRGNFQVSKYGLISTPYCEEENIARVAQSYGANVTGADVKTDVEPVPGVRLELGPHDRETFLAADLVVVPPSNTVVSLAVPPVSTQVPTKVL